MVSAHESVCDKMNCEALPEPVAKAVAEGEAKSAAMLAAEKPALDEVAAKAEAEAKAKAEAEAKAAAEQAEAEKKMAELRVETEAEAEAEAQAAQVAPQAG